MARLSPAYRISAYRLGAYGLAAHGLGALAFVLALLVSSGALAQANYDGVNLGGRTAMMGGAGVARGSDGATAFINPAGLSRIAGESFAFSTFAVELAGRRIENELDPSGSLGVSPNDATSLSVGFLPQTFCLFLDGPPRDHYSGRSRHKYGICAVETEGDAFLFSDNVTSPGRVTGVSNTTRMRWSKSTLAMAWALSLRPETSIGVTLRAESSRLEDQSSTAVYQDSGARMGMLDLVRTSTSWDVGVVLGLTHQISRYATLGASLSSPSQHLLGFHDGTESFSTSDGNVQSLVQDVGEFRYTPPANLRLGLGFAWPRFNFEVNASYYGSSSELAVATFDRSRVSTRGGQVSSPTVASGALVERGSPVVNFLAGAEFFLSRDFSLMVGAQTDFSALPRRQDKNPAEVLFRQSRDVFHGSLGVARYSSSGSLILGLRGFYATGQVLSADPALATPTYVALPQSEWSVSLVVSGQISFESVRDTALRAAAPFLREEYKRSLEREGR